MYSPKCMDKGWMKGLMMFSNGLAMWRKFNEGISNGGYVGKCAGSRSAMEDVVDTVKECLKKKKVWMSGNQGEW